MVCQLNDLSVNRSVSVTTSQRKGLSAKEGHTKKRRRDRRRDSLCRPTGRPPGPSSRRALAAAVLWPVVL